MPLVEQELVNIPESNNTTSATGGAGALPGSTNTTPVPLVEQESVTLPESINTTRATSGAGIGKRSRV